MHVVKKIVAITIVLGICATGMTSPPVDQEATIGHELGRTIVTDSTSGMVFWMPPELWDIQGFKGLPRTEAQALLKLRQYQVVGVAIKNSGLGESPSFDQIISNRLNSQWKSKDEIGKSLRMLDESGRELTPLDPSWELDKETLDVLNDFRSGFAILGPLADNFHLFVFKSASEDHLPSALEKGMMRIRVDGQTYEWKLPIGSLFDPKECPKCHEELCGAYSFCPWDGTELPK